MEEHRANTAKGKAVSNALLLPALTAHPHSSVGAVDKAVSHISLRKTAFHNLREKRHNQWLKLFPAGSDTVEPSCAGPDSLFVCGDVHGWRVLFFKREMYAVALNNVAT